MEWALEQPYVQHAMQTSTWHSGAALAGRDRGYVVEAKVLRGKFGAADMYVPGLDLEFSSMPLVVFPASSLESSITSFHC
jgi:hypothetical protein